MEKRIRRAGSIFARRDWHRNDGKRATTFTEERRRGVDLSEKLFEHRMNQRIFILNGPNLNLLGVREPEIYGRETLADIEAACRRFGAERNLEIEFRQSNHEGVLVDWVQEARGEAAAIILNPAGFTTTSISLLDALKMFEGPIIEVHLSNIHRRESFRHHSYVSLAATGVICGLGARGYLLALDAVAGLLGKQA
jgi:3-dehydroquinate dehydratase II